MGILRIMSWNLRTLGSQPPDDAFYTYVCDIITVNQPDIICIQELQTGQNIGDNIGSEISDQISDIIYKIRDCMNEIDPEALWWADVSGVDSGRADHMRDAYAFIWMTCPASSKFHHFDPVNKIEDECDGPIILRIPGKDTFQGRRPAMMTFKIYSGGDHVLLNLISYHNRTGCDKFEGNNSGLGIIELAKLKEIGGDLVRRTGKETVSSGNPLPEIDTVLVGDFNYSTDAARSTEAYGNLMKNYQPCINVPGSTDPKCTTYSPVNSKEFRLVSAYDNVFVLKRHINFAPAIQLMQSYVFDFIHKMANDFSASSATGMEIGEAWMFVHPDLYKKQHGIKGLSDHLPVFADFAIIGGSTKSDGIKPTDGSYFNCLFHAAFGEEIGGVYSCRDASERRNNLALILLGYLNQESFPITEIRTAILGAMGNEFESGSDGLKIINSLRANTVNPFSQKDFKGYYLQYVDKIFRGRMLYVEEAMLVAYIWDITISIWLIHQGRVQNHDTYNRGKRVVNIFHQGLHFNRYIPPA